MCEGRLSLNEVSSTLLNGPSNLATNANAIISLSQVTYLLLPYDDTGLQNDYVKVSNNTICANLFKID